MTDEQKQAFADRMKAAREAKKNPVVETESSEPSDNLGQGLPENLESPEVPTEAVVEEPVAPRAKITLNFTKKIEVYINGKAYLGQTIEVDDMATASEIVRIAKEAYGFDVLR